MLVTFERPRHGIKRDWDLSFVLLEQVQDTPDGDAGSVVELAAREAKTVKREDGRTGGKGGEQEVDARFDGRVAGTLLDAQLLELVKVVLGSVEAVLDGALSTLLKVEDKIDLRKRAG